jgi:hypothetical protein
LGIVRRKFGPIVSVGIGVLGVVGPPWKGNLPVELAISGGHVGVVPRIVRRAPGEKERERRSGLGMSFYELDRCICLAVRFILAAYVTRGVVFEIRRSVVSVVEVVSGPIVIESEAIGPGRDETVARLLMVTKLVCPEMPLAIYAVS